MYCAPVKLECDVHSNIWLHSHSHYLAAESSNTILVLTRHCAAATYLSVMKKFPSAEIILGGNPIVAKRAQTFSNITNPELGL